MGVTKVILYVGTIFGAFYDGTGVELAQILVSRRSSMVDAV
jgi:hypothetical protein